MTEKTDRRSMRTRTALFDALISLILEKGYDAVSVQDIIDRANVGRSTFYAHCTGKQDLLRISFQRLRAFLLEARRNVRAEGEQDRILGFSLAMFEHACANKRLYGALIGGRGGGIATNEIRRILADTVRDDLADRYGNEAVPAELVVQHVVGTFVTVLNWCLERKRNLVPAQIDAMFRRLAIDGIAALTTTSREAVIGVNRVI